MPLNRQKEQRFRGEFIKVATQMRRDVEAEGFKGRTAITREMKRRFQSDTPYQRALRSYGERTLQLDWATILELIIKFLPLIFIFL